MPDQPQPDSLVAPRRPLEDGDAARRAADDVTDRPDMTVPLAARTDVGAPTGGDGASDTPGGGDGGWLPWLALAIVLAVAAVLRLTGADWDSGQHLHPDERFLTMVTTALDAPEGLTGYFDTQTSRLNPRNVGHELFVYGTLPINIVYAIALRLDKLSYGDVYLVGRQVMAVFDVLSILLLFLIGRQLYGWRVALAASVLAAFTAFLIQQSHFFTVDAAANFFVLLFFLAAVHMMRRGGARSIVVAGVAIGLALASKFSVWPLVPLAVLGLLLSDRRRGTLRDTGGWLRFGAEVVLLGLTAFLTLRVAQPDMWAGVGWHAVAADPGAYVSRMGVAPGWWHTLRGIVPDSLEPFLLPDPRWAENMKRVQGFVTGNGMDWPPNHQWWNRTPYVFPWRNMVVYGLGLPLGIWATLSWAAAGVALARGRMRHFLPWSWVAIVFAYQGVMWVKTMRYFLPIYPMAILLGAWGLAAFIGWTRRDSVAERGGRGTRWRVPALGYGVAAIVLGGTVVWGLMVTSIYTREHSRIAGSRWIYHNVPTAFALTVREGDLPGPLLPLRASNSLNVLDYEYRLDEDRRLDKVQVHVPGQEPIVVDGLRLGYVRDPSDDPEPETVRAWLTTSPFPDESGSLQGIIAEGEVIEQLGADERHLDVPLPPVTLEPGGEYYAWIGVEGAPIAGRLPVLAVETSWDDHIPVGLDGLHAWDDAGTAGAEGFYGQVNLQLYDEDDSGKVDRLADNLSRADFIVITSNRVYGSVAQLPSRFPMTNEYYRALFDEELGFDHVADVHVYPRLARFEVNDQPADEAWHVYDHPKVDVFARTDSFDPVALRSRLEPELAKREWQWPSESPGALERLVSSVVETLPLPGSGAGGPVSPDAIMLPEDRWSAQRLAGTWSDIFDTQSLVNRSPVVAVVVWYLAVLLIGLLAFPVVAAALPGLADRGWAVSRIAGLLFVSWSAWLVASTGLVPHTPRLVLGAVVALALVATAIGGLAGRGRGALEWMRQHARVLLVEEAVFLALFLLFLVIRLGNPDLWHPYYGGEKPMDFAYLNAVLRTSAFPPYDPWFAGGAMNYYYFGFVMVGALIELTRIVPWMAYNLAIPTLAALLGTGVFGVTYSWSRSGGSRLRTALGAGVLGAVLAAVSGNLFQVPFIFQRIASLDGSPIVSAIPGLQRALDFAFGLGSLLNGEASLSVPTGHWYWNASRAIPDVPGDVQPITEFPFFTFLYADLHAHMMALPITVLALAVALSWAIGPSGDGRPGRAARLGRNALRVGLGALAIGALWPTNTWDFPTYGLVAAGGIALGQYARHRLGWRWLAGVLATGIPLLVLSLLLYWPYHANYVQPYGEFQRWLSIRTPLTAYLTIHGLLLLPLATWALLQVLRDLGKPSQRAATARRLGLAGLAFGLLLAVVWWLALRDLPEGKAGPSPWTPALGWFLLTIGTAFLARPRGTRAERFGAWLLLLGVGLTQLVEHVVLAGDIGRMNTVFKFYIQVWVLWSAAAATAVALLVPALRRSRWGGWWRGAFAVMLAAGLVYTVTAARAKISDRFPAMGPMSADEREAYDAGLGPGLSGLAFTDRAVYDDNGAYLHLRRDVDAMRWLLENVQGTPVILEGFREAGYRWGSRYSIYTGLPTVQGWDWHQKQQRNAAGGAVVDQRVSDVRETYNTTDIDRALALLRRYGVVYVVVGDMERAIYSGEGLAKFDEMVERGLAERVFGGGDAVDPGVIIYQIEHGGEG